MGDFKSAYRMLCERYKVVRQTNVENANIINGHLDLTNETLSTGTCLIIGKVAEAYNILTKVTLDNCLLQESDVSSLLLALSSNSSVTSLSLNGNGLCGTAVLELAKLLKCNKCLSRISLEWNNVGMNSTNLAKLCDALGKNESIVYLDMKNNNISSEDAQYIAEAIKKNISLICLDLSYNNIEEDGGKMILDGLKENATLLTLPLQGNHISYDVLDEIESHLCRNKELHVQKGKYISEWERMKQSLKIKEEETTKLITYLERNLSSANSSLTSVIRESQQKVYVLKEELEAKSSEADVAKVKFTTAGSLLEKEQERNKELSETKATLEIELTQLKEVHDHFVKRSSEAGEMHDKEKEDWKFKCQELESRVKKSQNENFSLKEKIITLEMEVKVLKCECEEQVKTLKSEQKETLKKSERTHTIQMKRYKTEMEEKETEYKKKIEGLESLVNELANDLRSSKLQLLSENEKHQVEMDVFRQQMKNEQRVLVRGLDDKLREVQRSREELEDKNQQNVEAYANMTTINSRLESKILRLNNDIASLRAELEGKENEVRIAERRVRAEVESQLDELDLLKEARDSTREKIQQMQSTHEAEMKELVVALKKQEEAGLQLRQRLNERDHEMLKMKEEETRRVSLLQSAFVQYLHPSSN